MGLLGQCRPSVRLSVSHQLLLNFFFLCQLRSDFDETRYERYEGKELQSYRADFQYLHKLSNYATCAN